MTSVNRCIHEGDNTCVPEKRETRRSGVSVEIVIGMSRGSAWFIRREGGCNRGDIKLKGGILEQSKGPKKMWSACEIFVCISPDITSLYTEGREERGVGGGRGRWSCPSATRLHIGKLRELSDP